MTYRDYENQCRELERKNAALNKEIERLNNIIRNNSQENDNYRTKINKLESNINDYKNIEMKLKDFEHKIAMLIQEN